MKVMDEKGVMSGSEFFSHIPNENEKKLLFFCYEAGHYIVNDEFMFRNNQADRGKTVPFLICLNSGSMEADINGKNVLFQKGDIAFFNTSEVHKYNVKLRIPRNNTADIYWAIIHGSNVDSFQSTINQTRWYIPMSNNQRILDNLMQIYGMYSRYNSVFAEKISQSIYEILLEMLKPQKINSKELPIDTALQYINDHYTESTLSVRDIADYCCLSHFYFTRLFKDIYGVTPYNYITNKRLFYAKTMLTMSNMSIFQVAVKVGYRDQTVFIRAFRKKFGITPGNYRKGIDTE